MPFLKPAGAQIADVIKIAESSEDISSLEERVRRNGARQLWLMILTLVASTAALVGFLLVLASSEPSALELYLVSFGIEAAYFWLMLNIIFRSGPEYITFLSLVSCIPKVDDAIGSEPASRARSRAARKIVISAWRIRGYGPIIPLSLRKRIISREATRASRALRGLAYPVLLGTDTELNQVKEALAGAAIRVGTTKWVQVGDLHSISSTSKRSRLLEALLLPLLAGVVVPLATALISLAAKG
jgi:hypothetical protein